MQLPVTYLRSIVSHYWLSHDNVNPDHTILPDGCIDAVFEFGRTTGIRVYGAATRRSSCVVSIGYHYLGICFRPGQARHFLEIPAVQLTDCSVEISDLASLEPETLADDIASGTVFQRLNSTLATWLERRPRTLEPVEQALYTINCHNGNVRIETMAAEMRLSRRQLERRFLAAVGIPPKTYAGIRRLQWALTTLRAQPTMPLATVALDAGYADQSHMSRNFQRLLGQSPRSAVAFVQDASFPSDYTTRIS